MARRVARQFCRLGEVHSLVYGRRASGKNGRKLAASTRVGSKSRLMNYLGSTHFNCSYSRVNMRFASPDFSATPSLLSTFTSVPPPASLS